MVTLRSLWRSKGGRDILANFICFYFLPALCHLAVGLPGQDKIALSPSRRDTPHAPVNPCSFTLSLTPAHCPHFISSSLDPLPRLAHWGCRSQLQHHPQESAGYASPQSGSTSMPPAPTCTPAGHRREPPCFPQPLGPRLSSSVPSPATAAPRSSSSPNSSRDHDGLRVVRISSGPWTRSRGSLLLLPWRWLPLSLSGARCSAPSNLATYSMGFLIV